MAQATDRMSVKDARASKSTKSVEIHRSAKQLLLTRTKASLKDSSRNPQDDPIEFQARLQVEVWRAENTRILRFCQEL